MGVPFTLAGGWALKSLYSIVQKIVSSNSFREIKALLPGAGTQNVCLVGTEEKLTVRGQFLDIEAPCLVQ